MNRGMRSRTVRIEQIERYVIHQEGERVRLDVVQGRRAVRVTLLATVGAGAAWAFGPLGPLTVDRLPPAFAWAAFGLLALFAAGGMVGMVYREHWHFSPSGIERVTTFGRDRLTTTPPRARIEVASGRARRQGVRVFPYEVRFLRPEGTPSSLVLALQSPVALKRLVRRLEAMLDLEVAEVVEVDATVGEKPLGRDLSSVSGRSRPETEKRTP